jgi:hypothetical protein
MFNQFAQTYTLDDLVWGPLRFPEPKVRYEGGDTTTETKYAIKANDGMAGYASGPTSGFGWSLEDAILFDDLTAASAALREIAEHRDVKIVAVTVTTTSPRVRVTTTEIPAKTVYQIIRLSDGVALGPYLGGDEGFNYVGRDVLEFPTANAAALRIEQRNAKYGYLGGEFAIKPVTTPRDVKIEKTTVAPASTSRSV